MRRTESPFVDAESPFVDTESPFVDRATFESDPEYSYEQFEDLLDLWTPTPDDEADRLHEDASDAEDAEPESLFEEPEASFEGQETNTVCTDTGFGIVGADDRRKVKNPLEVPCRWICHLFVRRRDSNGTVTRTGGTGVLISPRHVLTVAHLITTAVKDDRGQWITSDAFDIRVTPARDGNDRPLGTYGVKLPAHVAPNWNPIGKPNAFDYALLTLDTPVGDEGFKALGGRKLCYWGSRSCGAGSTMRVVKASALNGRSAITAGYPKDKGGEIPYITRGLISEADSRRETMKITADACRGQSGSPVWLKVGNENCMVGMMVWVGQTANIALRINDDVCRTLRAWMKGASDVCLPRPAATSGTARPQPELALPARGQRCRCGREDAEAEAGTFEALGPELEEAEDGETETEGGDGELEEASDYQMEETDLEIDDSTLEETALDDEEGAAEDETSFEARELDPAVADLAERVFAREDPFVEHQTSKRWTLCFSAADVAKVQTAYQDNAVAAGESTVDRCSCIVMLNVALGQLLPIKLKNHRARGKSTRQVRMGALTTSTIEKAMKQLRGKGFATAPTVMDFYDRRNRTAGTLKPERLKASVRDKVLSLSNVQGCWFAFGLSIMDGYHSVLLLVDTTTTAARIFWLDQFSPDLSDDVTATLDQRITEKTQTWWESVMNTKGKGYDTTIRLWALRKPHPRVQP